MASARLIAFTVAVSFANLIAWDARACSCGAQSSADKFSQADLVVKGRMKTVTYGIELRDPDDSDQAWRLARGDIEVIEVLKGTLNESAIQVYTGSGMGDCGLLGAFINSAIYYNQDEFGVFELGLTKNDYAGQTLYMSTICDYAKGHEDEE